MARVVKPDGKKISDLCNQKGWGATELAHKADLSLATASKIMKGEECYRASLGAVARALGVSYADLIEGEQQPPNEPPGQKTVVWVFYLACEIAELDENRIKEFMASVQKLIGAKGEIEMIGMRSGSTMLALSFTQADSLRLVAALAEGGDDFCRQLGLIDLNMMQPASIRITAASIMDDHPPIVFRAVISPVDRLYIGSSGPDIDDL